jgi:uroporphyrinogen decarboxylase
VSEQTSEKAVLRVLDGEAVWPPPVWLMRQAGRHLPEYRETRARAGSFLDLCYNPELAAEVTLQPIRRFGYDAAILFSDILVVPQALGQPLWFVEGEGPRLEPVPDRAALDRLGEDLSRLDPIYETIRRVARELPARTTFLGFCGAPWTVATYMVAGRGTRDQGPARQAALEDPAFFETLIGRIVEASVAYLVQQFRAGVDAVQIFDSWAGALAGDEFRRWCVEPVAAIVAGVRAQVPGARIIAFPRGVASAELAIAAELPVQAFGIGQGADLEAARRALGGRAALQGNLDPDVLVEGGDALDRGIDAVLAAARGHPHVFNLGHGILPHTPIPHVERMLARVRAG